MAISRKIVSVQFEAVQRCRLCPGLSDVDLLSYRESVVDFDAKIPNGAFDFGVAEKQLDRPEIAGAFVDQRRFRPTDRVGSIGRASSIGPRRPK